MIERINENARLVDGRRMYPRMYGDDGWYDFRSTPWAEGALNCWFWTCAERDRQRVARVQRIEALLDGCERPIPALPVIAVVALLADEILGRVCG